MINPLWIVAGVATIAIGIQTLRLANTQEALATEKLAFVDFKRGIAEESLRFTREAAARSDQAIEALNRNLADVSIVSTKAKTEIRYVQSSGGPCAADPVYRATVSGVRDILDARGPGGDQGQAGRRPASVVRRTDASGPVQGPQR